MIWDMPVLDADSHVLEPNDLWRRYLAPEFRWRVQCLEGGRPRAFDFKAMAQLHLACQQAGVDSFEVLRSIGSAEFGGRHLLVDGAPIFDGISEEVWRHGVEHTLRHHLPALARRFSPDSHVEALRRMGVDGTYVYPTTALWMLAINTMEAEFAGALVRAYNQWLFDYCSTAPEFLRGVAAVCLHSPVDMLETLDWVVRAGWSRVYVRPNPVSGRTLNHPDYDPFWARCAECNIAVAIHEGTHARLPAAGAERFRSRFGRHACSHPMEQMMALLSLIEGGVLERFPALRVAFMESGCGWLPYWLWRLDSIEYKNLAWEVAGNVRMKPSDYFRRQCFIACEPDEPGLEVVVNELGVGCLLYGSDYPHVDHAASVSDDVQMLISRLGRAGARDVLWNNPVRFYGHDQQR